MLIVMFIAPASLIISVVMFFVPVMQGNVPHDSPFLTHTCCRGSPGRQSSPSHSWTSRLQHLLSLALYPAVAWYCTSTWAIMSLFGCFTGGPPPSPPPNNEVADLQKTVSKLQRKLAASQAAEQALKQQLEESSPPTEADSHEVDTTSITCLIKAQEDAASASLQYHTVKAELADLQEQMEVVQAQLVQAEANSTELRAQLEKASARKLLYRLLRVSDSGYWRNLM